MNTFPALQGQVFTANKSPTWTTITKKAANGRQVRCSLQSAPIWSFKLSYEFVRDKTPSTSEMQALRAFFNNAQGQFSAWQYLDPYDNIVTNQEMAIGDGLTTTFQFVRTVGASTAYPFIEPVYALNGAPVIEVAGAVVSGFTLGAFGTVTFSSPPANGAAITWSGSFYYLCHFTQDNLDATQMVSNMWSIDGLTFESLLP